MKQAVGNRRVRRRIAVVPRRISCEARALHVSAEVNVMRHEEIEPSVAVVVEERGARAPAGVACAGRRRNVGKGAVALVAEHVVGAKPGDVDVYPAVVVVVTGRGAHAIDGNGQTGRLRDVGEPQATVGRRGQIIAVETTGRTGPASFGAEGLALNGEEIEVAVVVVIEERAA